MSAIRFPLFLSQIIIQVWIQLDKTNSMYTQNCYFYYLYNLSWDTSMPKIQLMWNEIRPQT